MTVRRVVTGHDPHGRSVVVWDSEAPAHHDFEAIAGMSTTTVWATPSSGWADPRDGDPSTRVERHVPAPGESRFVIVTFPPDGVFASPDFDPMGASAEQQQVSPDLAALFERDAPGMHTTPTVDYAVVLSGTVWLELDDHVLVPLTPGDTVVQNRTRHAWRNLGAEPTIVAFVNLGTA